LNSRDSFPRRKF